MSFGSQPSAGRCPAPVGSPARASEYQTDAPIGSLFNCSQTADIRLLLGNRTLHAHRLVLSAASPVFRAMLSGDWLESGSGCVRLDEDDCGGGGEEAAGLCCFPDVLRFMYTGRVVLDSAGRLLEVHRLADKYGVTSLLQLCSGRVLELLRIRHTTGPGSPLATRGEFSPGQLCRLACLPDQRISRLARFNLLVDIGDELRRGHAAAALLPVPAELPDLLERLLADDNLDAPEAAIFDGLAAWLLRRRPRLDRPGLLRLLACVRFPLMPADQLLRCERRLRRKLLPLAAPPASPPLPLMQPGRCDPSLTPLGGSQPARGHQLPLGVPPAADPDADDVIVDDVSDAEELDADSNSEYVFRLLAPAWRHLALRTCLTQQRQPEAPSPSAAFRRRHPFDILASTVRPLVVLLTPCSPVESGGGGSLSSGQSTV